MVQCNETETATIHIASVSLPNASLTIWLCSVKQSYWIYCLNEYWHYVMAMCWLYDVIIKIWSYLDRYVQGLKRCSNVFKHWQNKKSSTILDLDYNDDITLYWYNNHIWSGLDVIETKNKHYCNVSDAYVGDSGQWLQSFLVFFINIIKMSKYC